MAAVSKLPAVYLSTFVSGVNRSLEVRRDMSARTQACYFK